MASLLLQLALDDLQYALNAHFTTTPATCQLTIPLMPILSRKRQAR